MDTAQNGMLYAFQKCKHQLFSSTRLISIKFSNVSGLFGGPCSINIDTLKAAYQQKHLALYYTSPRRPSGALQQ